MEKSLLVQGLCLFGGFFWSLFFFFLLVLVWEFLVGFDSWVRKMPWRRDRLPTPVFLGFLGGSDSKESAHNVEDLGWRPGLKTWVRSLGWEDPLAEGMATHSSILAWKSPWTEEPGGLHGVTHGVTESWIELSNWTTTITYPWQNI